MCLFPCKCFSIHYNLHQKMQVIVNGNISEFNFKFQSLNIGNGNSLLSEQLYKLYIYYIIYIFIAALIFLLEYFRITRAFCILPYCTVYIVRYTTHARSE